MRFALCGSIYLAFLCCGLATAVAQPVAVGVVESRSMDRWGVGMIEIPVGGELINQTVPPLAVESVGGETILFPVAEEVRVAVRPPSEQPVPRPGDGRLLGRLRNLIREIGDPPDATPQQTIARRVTFLFPQHQPMTVRVSDASGVIGEYSIDPQIDPTGHRDQLSRWWRGFTGGAGDQVRRGDYPPRVEAYLVAMLAGRLDLPLPDWYLPDSNPATSVVPGSNPITGDDDPIWGTLALIGGAETVSDQMFRRVASGVGIDNQVPTEPLPAPPIWAPDPALPIAPEVEIEPLAGFVPPECFYLRYGSFENFLWFKELTERNGGDVARMLLIRGIADNASERLERQLNLQTNDLSKTLGPSVIEDQAIIGTDLFLADGGSVGTLIKAKQPFLLRTSLNGDRRRRAANDDEVTLVEKESGFGSATVSFLSSGDGRIRSFMTESDGVFLVTNSRHLMKRFLAVRQSGPSLADTPLFAAARTSVPLSRGDTVFAYFSTQMMRGLLSPKSMIELRRRLITESETALVPLARLASRQENPELRLDIDSLIANGYLPTTFGNRPDGSGLIDLGDPAIESDWLVVDTLRGRPGTYLPIADVEIDQVTRTESEWYAEIASAYSSRFSTLDPIAIGIARSTPQSVAETVSPRGNGPAVERLSIRAEISPFRPEKYGKYAKYLGPPTTMAIRFAPDDLVAGQAHVASAQLGPPTHLFAAIKDTVPPDPDEFKGILKAFRSVRGIPGYVGAWPQPGLLDRLPLGIGRGTPVGPGISRLIGGIYRYSDGSFSLLGFDPYLIEQSVATIEAIEVPEPAQVRLLVGDLLGSQLEPWLIQQAYEATAPKSLAGANFLSLLMRQFALSYDQTIASAEQILGGRIQCPLGGEYRFDQSSGRWYSTAWVGDPAWAGVPPEGPPPVAPAGYRPPPLEWFAGGRASLIQEPDRLAINAVVDLRLGPLAAKP